MSGRATFATARFRFATAATRISEMRTSAARAGTVDVSSGERAAAVAAPAVVDSLTLSRASGTPVTRASSGWDEPPRTSCATVTAMGETITPGEVAHTVVHAHGGPISRKESVIEVAEALLLAIVAIATAWSGYQTGKWDGEQASLYNLSSRYRVQADSATT